MRISCRVVFSLLLTSAFALGLSSCADKMTDQHSAMVGGSQNTHPAGVSSVTHTGTPANSDGVGRPLAGGKQNTTPDTMWNQSSPAGGRAF